MRTKTLFLMMGSLLLLSACSTSSYRSVSPSPKLESREHLEVARQEETYYALGRSSMVVTAHPLASEVGANILKEGGNACDAAIAVTFVISVVRPQSTGIGGGGFLMFHDGESKTTSAYDFRERAPLTASRDMYVKKGVADTQASLVGHLAVGVPGIVAGMVEVHRRCGSMPWKRLLDPAIRLARDGIEVYPELAERLEKRKDAIRKNTAMTAIFFKGDEPLELGDVLVQTDLAHTLESISEKGRAGFYVGFVAEAIEADMNKHGGLITTKDLDLYRVYTRQPVKGQYRGYEVHSMPPPSSGGVHIVQMLKVLEGFPLRVWGVGSDAATHVMIESMRQAYADRAHWLGDPDYVTVPIPFLTSRDYAMDQRQGIQMSRARKSSEVRYAKINPNESTSTTHFSIADRFGNLVASTQTINYSFGACVVAEGTGVILNDEMDDFSIKPGVPNVYGLLGGEANAIAPFKTPLSSMSPTFVFKDGKPVMVLGSPGGSRIITAVLQTILNVVDFDMSLLEAVSHTRIHHQWMPDKVWIENRGFPEKSVSKLKSLGHTIEVTDRTFGDVQAIKFRKDGIIEGVSDPRGVGKPVGY